MTKVKFFSIKEQNKNIYGAENTLLHTQSRSGFSSPATDYIEDDVDLNHHLIKNSPATFIIRVQGKSMNSVESTMVIY